MLSLHTHLCTVALLGNDTYNFTSVTHVISLQSHRVDHNPALQNPPKKNTNLKRHTHQCGRFFFSEVEENYTFTLYEGGEEEAYRLGTEGKKNPHLDPPTDR